MEKGTVSQLKTLMFTGHAAIIDQASKLKQISSCYAIY